MQIEHFIQVVKIAVMVCTVVNIKRFIFWVEKGLFYEAFTGELVIGNLNAICFFWSELVITEQYCYRVEIIKRASITHAV